MLPEPPFSIRASGGQFRVESVRRREVPPNGNAVAISHGPTVLCIVPLVDYVVDLRNPKQDL